MSPTTSHSSLATRDEHHLGELVRNEPILLCVAARKEPAMTISRSSVVSAGKDQVFTELEQEAVILNLTDGTYYGLDAVGAYVWKLIQTPTTLRDLHAAVLDRYDVETERCAQDLASLFEHMSDAGLIEFNDATAH
jgi:hypothetical protein